VDAENIAKLSKQDMLDFYSHYISTSSSQRAKLSVHLQAQAKPAEPSLDEKKTSAVAALKIILAEHKISPNDEALQSRIDGVSSADTLPEAISNFLTEDVKVEKEVANKVLDEAKAALGVADSGLPAAPQALDAAADMESVVDASHPVLIQDVHAWKASMQISSGVKPVRNLEEFVEVAEKL
jgi:insulysin